MKTTINIIALFTLAFIINSCEKVIDIDLNEAEKHIIIEANLQEGEHDFSVLISKTAPYFDDQNPEAIENAQVTLSDGLNNSIEIPHKSNGEYVIPITGIAKSTYSLAVEIDGIIYEASSYLPPVVILDTVYSVFEEAFGPHDAGYNVYFAYTDPLSEPNFYRSSYSLNGIHQNTADDLRVFNDNISDGNKVEQLLAFHKYNLEDTLLVELIHFDNASFDYFSTLGDIIGGGGPRGGSAAPANPNTNWYGGCLGYFSAYSKDTFSIVVTE